MSKKELQHPFGRENEISAQQLVTFFCNNVYLGQWELANACIHELESQKEILGVDVVEILREISCVPYGYSLGADNIDTPHHLSWLCYQEIHRHRPDQLVLIKKLKEDISFRLLLVELRNNDISSDQHITEELYAHYKTVSTDDAVTSDTQYVLSSKCRKIIYDTLYKKPCLGVSIIEALDKSACKKSHCFAEYKCFLPKIHLDVLRNILENIKISKCWEEIKRRKCTKTFYQLLALFSIDTNHSNLMSTLKEFFLCLLKVIHGEDTKNLLDKKNIYSALLGKKNNVLLDIYLDLEFMLRCQDLAAGVDQQINLSSRQLEFVGLSRCKNRLYAWKMLYVFCVKYKIHFLDHIMELSVELIRLSAWQHLDWLLLPDEFHSLRPLILLVGWDHCQDLSSTRKLLQTLMCPQSLCVHQTLSLACTRLSQQVALTEWCIDQLKTRDYLFETGVQMDKNYLALVRDLQTHSLLYILHHLTSFSSLPSSVVLDLITNRPASGYNTLHKNEDTQKVKKTVRFTIEENDDETTEEHSSVELQRDLSIYNSYYAMNCFLMALKYCVNNSSFEDMCSRMSSERNVPSQTSADDVKSSRSFISGSSSSSTALENVQLLYDQYVTQKLREGSKHLREIFPLTVRLEVLENIFSLIFVKHDSFEESPLIMSDSGDEGTEEPNSYPSSHAGKFSSPSSPTSTPSSLNPFFPQESQSLENSDEYMNSWIVVPEKNIVTNDPRGVNQEAAIKDILSGNDNASKTSKERSSSPDLLTTQGVKQEPEYKKTSVGLYSITTAQLKDSLSGAQSAPPTMVSGQLSANSSCSTTSVGRIGFVCNEFLVRDILHILKDALVDLSALRYTFLGQHNTTTTSESNLPVIPAKLESDLTNCVECGVESSSLQHRLTRLTQYVSEAQWRLQLVTPDWIPIPCGKVIPDSGKLNTSLSEEDIEEELMECKLFSRTTKQNEQYRLNLRTNSTGEESCTDGLSDGLLVTDGSASCGSSSGGRAHRRRQRKRLKGRRSRIVHMLRQQSSVVSHMLASSETLLNMCLRRAKYTHAQQIIKMFNMEGSLGAAETLFAQQFINAVSKLKSKDESSVSQRQAAGSKSKQGLLGRLSAIANVAAVGIASVSSMSAVDQLLGLSALPGFSPDTVNEIICGGASYCNHLNPDYLPSMIVMDLACAGSQTISSSRSVLEAARSRMPNKLISIASQNYGDKKKHLGGGFHPPGVGILLQEFISLTNLGRGEKLPDTVKSHYNWGLNVALSSGTRPIHATELQKLANLLYDLEKSAQKVVKAVEDSRFQHSFDGTPREGGSFAESKPHVRIAMKNLMTICKHSLPSSGLAQSLLQDDTSQLKHQYLHSVYEHVKALAELVNQYEKGNSSKEYFRLLDTGPTQIIGKVLFVSNVLPERLEEMASKLHLNLTQIIINSCCPNIPCGPSQSSSTLPLNKDCDADNRILVMNCFDGVKPSDLHPAALVSHILSDLIALMKDVVGESEIFTEEMVPLLTRSSIYNDLIRKSALLANTDLTLLDTVEDRLCFYGNLYNLMRIHGCIHQAEYIAKLKPPPNTFPRHRVFSTTSASSLTSHCSQALDYERISHLDNMLQDKQILYNVGQLGQVSLFDLSHILLRQGLRTSQRFNGFLEAFCNDLDKDDIWHKLSPPAESRMFFVLCEGTPSSPPLQVLNPENIDQQLNEAMNDYLNYTISVNTDILKDEMYEEDLFYSDDRFLLATLQMSKLIPTSFHSLGIVVSSMRYIRRIFFIAITHRIWLSLPLWEHRQDFVNLLDSDDSSGAVDSLTENFLCFIADNVDLDVAADIRILLDSKQGNKNEIGNIDIALEDVCSTEIAYAYNFSVWSKHYQQMKTEVPFDEMHTSPSPLTISLPTHGKYSLTASTLDHLRSCSDLVATVAALVSQDSEDIIQNELQEDHFPVKTPETDKDQCQLFENNDSHCYVGLRQFKYQKLQMNYPIIQRHFYSQILPLAACFDRNILYSANMLWDLTSRRIPSYLQASVLSGSADPLYQEVLRATVCWLTDQQNWQELVSLLGNVPALSLHTNPCWSKVKDLIFRCAGLSLKSNTSWQYLIKIEDSTFRMRTVLGHLHLWNPTICINLLKISLSTLEDSDLKSLARRRLFEIQVFEKVAYYADMCLQNVNNINVKEDISPEDVLQSARNLITWQGVRQMSETQPSLVLDFLLTWHNFDIIYQWADIFDITYHLRQKIHQYCIFHLLEKDQPDVLKAFHLFEKMKQEDIDACLRTADNILTTFSMHKNVLFVAEFMLQHLLHMLDEERQQQLHLLCTGCRAILKLPVTAQADYDHLLAAPLLLLEQLLMNMRIDWARKVLRSIEQDLVRQKQGLLTLGVARCNELLVTYATKALEFSVIQAESTEPMSRSQSRLSLASIASVQYPRGHKRISSGSGMIMGVIGQQSHLPESRSLAILGRSAPAGFGIKSSMYSSLSNISQPGTSPRPLAVEKEVKPFVMPATPPTRAQWVPDGEAPACMVCRVEKFSMFDRRHHCRRCGRVVCAACSSRTSMIRGSSARTCDQCYQQIFRPRIPPEDPKMKRLKENMGSQYGSDVKFVVGSPDSHASSPEPSESYTSEQLTSRDNLYVLSLEEDINILTRQEFYYDNAPSTSLCLSLLELHGDNSSCGRFILELCDQVSCQLQPLAPGVRNPEVDYAFVISMLKSLLLNAKVKLMTAGDQAGVSQCEIYMDRISLLNTLVTNGCNYIPSVQQLTKMDVLRRLRDCLLKEERWLLAVDLSTKCGLPAVGVWAAWGHACLRAGHYSAAREKYSKCLKAGSDTTGYTNKVVGEIITTLEKNVATVDTGNADLLLNPLRSMKDLLALPPKMTTGSKGLNDSILQECVYYLQTYGTPVMLLLFYHRHGYLSTALKYVLGKQSSPEVYLEGILLPCLESGQLVNLQEQMTFVDSNLNSWSGYLTASCRFLNKRGFWHSLYQTQLFMKDYIRAAMTCVTHFYLRGADSYLVLHHRIPHLTTAKRHLEAYLKEQLWVVSGHPGSSPGRPPTWGRPSTEVVFQLIMTPAEVAKYMHTIDLQIEVTKFLNRYHDNFEMKQESWNSGGLWNDSPPTGSSTRGPSPSQTHTHDETKTVSPTGIVKSPTTQKEAVFPTLFGGSRLRSQVASLILLSGNNVNDGFGLTFRIIQDFKLDASFIYTLVGRQCARQLQYASIRQLLGCIKDSGISSEAVSDEVIAACVRVIADQTGESKEAESLIRLIKSETNKVNAYILCGKLRSAYLICVKAGRVDDVKRISRRADSAGQIAVKNICDKWLQQRGEYTERNQDSQ